MIGILIVTHGHLSESLLDTASMFVSDNTQTSTVTFLAGQGVEDLEASVRGAIQELTPNDGILALVDLPGGSPARVIGGLLFENEKIELLTGVNLPMLVEVLMLRGSLNLAELADYAIESGKGGIANIARILRSEGGVL